MFAMPSEHRSSAAPSSPAVAPLELYLLPTHWGVNQILEVLSASASKALSASKSIECDVDFNLLMSGYTDPYTSAGHLVSVTFPERTERFKEGLTEATLELARDGNPNMRTIEEAKDHLSSTGVGILHYKVKVHSMPIILQRNNMGSSFKRTVKTEDLVFPKMARGSAGAPVSIVTHFRRGDILIFPLGDKFITGWESAETIVPGHPTRRYSRRRKMQPIPAMRGSPMSRPPTSLRRD